jgi:hypothetical protein
LIHGVQRRFRCECQKATRRRNTSLENRLSGQKFAAADFCDFSAVYRGDVVVIKYLESMYGSGMIDTAFDNNIQMECIFVEIKDRLSIVDLNQFDAFTASEFF